MTLRDTAPTGAPCWIDILSSDTDKARAFYGELFGWVGEDASPDFGGYFNFTLNGVRVAGCMGNDGAQPDAWTTYLAVEDAAKVTEQAKEHGGQAYMEPMPIADLGVMGMLADPGSAAIGIWQPGEHKGFGVLDEPGAPSWFELHTRTYDDSVQFYRDVFAWDTHTVSDDPTFRYTTLGEGDGQLAGIMDNANDLPEGTPAFWTIYFKTDDVDGSVAKIVELGGAIIDQPVDTPYGRLASGSDPTGTRFSLRGPNNEG